MKFKKPSLTEKILLVASAVVLTAMFLPSCLAIRSFDQIEDKAHKAITGAELQAWATNLLANPPTTIDVRISELVTNFPQRLFGLYQDPPFIRIRPAETNSPGSVFLMLRRADRTLRI